MRRGGWFLQVNLLVALGLVLAALFIPRLVTDLAVVRVFTIANVFVMFAVSWDILSGYSGQINLGHAAFIGTAGFTAGLLSKFADLPLEVTIVLGMATAALIGLLIGIPALRLKGPFLALATLAAAAALLRIVFVFKAQTGGEEGIPGLPGFDMGTITGPSGRGMARLFLGPGTFDELSAFDQFFFVNYYVVLALTLAMVIGLVILGESNTGLVLRSIRQDEDAAEAAGVPTTRYKLVTFVLSAALAGLAGSIWVHIVSHVGINTLVISLSFIVIVMAMVGGMGTIVGPVIGAYLVVWSEDFFLEKLIGQRPDVQQMAFGVLLILVVIVRPQGLIGPYFRRVRRARRLAQMGGLDD